MELYVFTDRRALNAAVRPSGSDGRGRDRLEVGTARLLECVGQLKDAGFGKGRSEQL
jgi:hypothetical protein